MGAAARAAPALVGTVTDTFTIRGHGVAALLSPNPDADWRVNIGDIVELRRPDGARRVARVTGIDRHGPGLLFEPAVGKDDLPPGTEVWTVVPET